MNTRVQHRRAQLALSVLVVVVAATVVGPSVGALSAATTPCSKRDSQFVAAARQSQQISAKAIGLAGANRSFEAEELIQRAIRVLKKATMPCQVAMKTYRELKLRVFEFERQSHVARQRGDQRAADAAGNASSEWRLRAAEAEMKWRGNYAPIEQLTRLWRATPPPSTGGAATS